MAKKELIDKIKGKGTEKKAKDAKTTAKKEKNTTKAAVKKTSKKTTAKKDKKKADETTKAVVTAGSMPPGVFDYTVITDEKKREAAMSTADSIKQLNRNVLTNIVDIGAHLLVMKDKLEHGTYQLWCERELGYTYNHAYNFMRVALKFSKNRELVGELNMSPTTLMALAQVRDEKIFSNLIKKATKEKITEAQVKVEARGARTSASGTGTTAGKRGTVGTTSTRTRGTKMERTYTNFQQEINEGANTVIAAVTALKNMDVPDDDSAEEASVAIRQDLHRLLVEIIPVFDEDEIDQINADRPDDED